MTGTFELALVGLGVMGRALAANLADHGHAVVGFDRSPEARRRAAGEGLPVAGSLVEALSALSRPRTVLLMVPAGAPVDELVDRLAERLEPGDAVIDGGNSHWRDTIRRAEALGGRGLGFLGLGVSGGEQGARLGPSLMAGGDLATWQRVSPVLEAVAARAAGRPSAARLGPHGAGHFAKAVHNGIEYADLQLVAETHALLSGLGADLEAQARTFERWNDGPAGSLLTELAVEALRARDPATGRPALEVIVDSAGQKGTGAWAALAALELGVAAPTIVEAVSARLVSARREARRALAPRRPAAGPPRQTDALTEDELGRALHAGRLSAHAQGFDLLEAGSAAGGFGLELGTVARLWSAGSILRSKLLVLAGEACERGLGPAGLLGDERYGGELLDRLGALRRVVSVAASSGLAVPALGSALAFVESMLTARLPANLVQAERDLFGAHGFERVDRPGRFHLDGSEA